MGVDLRSNAIDTSHALRASERATQFTRRFQAAPRLILFTLVCNREVGIMVHLLRDANSDYHGGSW